MDITVWQSKETMSDTGPTTITAQTLKTKIADLMKEREQLVANVNAVAGAIQAYEALLEELHAPPEDPCP